MSEWKKVKLGEIEMNSTDNKEQAMTAVHTQSLIHDLRQIIEQARGHVAATANYALTMMYWHIGERINSEVLGNQRAEYGKQIVSQIARQLQEEYGKKGFEERTIRRMMQFAQTFPNFQILSPLVSKLSWSHFLILMTLKDELQREFYLTMAASEQWSKRTLQSKIDGMLYERTAVSSKPDELIKKELVQLRDENILSPDLVFKSPYFLEFTGLKGMYSEKSLEDSLVAHLEQFIIELGNGFSFVARQKRMIIDGEDFYHVYWSYNKRQLRIVEAFGSADCLPAKDAIVSKGITPSITQLKSTELYGMGYVVQLCDGSFIIVDGGWSFEHDRLYDKLVELNGGSKEDIELKICQLYAEKEKLANVTNIVRVEK